MKEKELIEKIQNDTFSIGVKLIINNNYTNKVLTSSVIFCCNKVNNEWLIYDEGPEDRSDLNDKYFYFKSNKEEKAIDFFFNRILREDRIYARKLQKKIQKILVLKRMQKNDFITWLNARENKARNHIVVVDG